MSNLPGFTAESALAGAAGYYEFAGHFGYASEGASVIPQVCVGSPCLGLPSGRFCINLPVVGRRCVNIPSFGRWRIRCCTRWGWPPVRCGVARC